MAAAADTAKMLGDIGAGKTLGRYELLVPIAQGGMAIVWAARMTGSRGFQKIIALKSMLPALSEDSQFEEMFLAEAGVASRIKHPNVCEILDLGEDDGVLYIVMEWVDGESLSAIQKQARAKRREVPLGVIARVACAAAQGLHAAHELVDDTGGLVGLVHRDVSPQNILVTYDGTVKIVDFGIAKATATGDGLTQAGQVKGKVPYMAPEQVLGRPLDRRADIFALGTVLYQMTTSKHPFRGENEGETMRRIVSRSPVDPPRSLVPTIPEALEAVILRALQKDREERFATMADMAKALEGVIGSLRDTDSDVASFVRDVIGERGDKRRGAIKDAQRIADLRRDLLKATTGPNGPASVRGEQISEVSMLTIPLATELSPAPQSGISEQPSSRPSNGTGQAIVALSAYPPRQRKRAPLFAAAGAVALFVAVVLYLALRSPSADPAEAQGAPAAPPASATIAAAPATAAPSATASAAPTGDSQAPAASTETPTAKTAAPRPNRTGGSRGAATAKPKSTGPVKILNPGF